jgi:hypothetical protein
MPVKTQPGAISFPGPDEEKDKHERADRCGHDRDGVEGLDHYP